MLAGIILGVVWFTLFVFCHAGLFHLHEIRRRSAAILASFGGALLGFVASVAVESYDNPVAATLGGVFIMFSMFILYMPFYYTIATSLSVQTLIAIQRAHRHQMPIDQLRAAFVSKDLLQRRLEAMVQSGLLQNDGSGFRLTRKGRCVARLFNAVKLLWRLEPGG